MKTLALLAIAGLFFGLSCQKSGGGTGGAVITQKINGLSFVAPVEPTDSSVWVPVRQVHANWVCLMPFAFGSEEGSELRFDETRQWWGETSRGVAACLTQAHAAGQQVMIKPQVWFRRGTYTGFFELKTPAEWEAFEGRYRQFILTHARVADSLQADLFCVGTEWDRFVALRPDFWNRLIREVRTIYDGPLTYAANWDTYDDFPHWSQLDYVGVDAYFPLVDAPTPTVGALVNAWKPHLKRLEAFHEKVDRPILFTEYGYRSADGGTARPWEHHETGTPNNLTQQRAYEALFQHVWPQSWLAGGFVWKWYEPRQLARRESRWHRMDTDYSPQGKPAETTLREAYTRHTPHP